MADRRPPEVVAGQAGAWAALALDAPRARRGPMICTAVAPDAVFTMRP